MKNVLHGLPSAINGMRRRCLLLVMNSDFAAELQYYRIIRGIAFVICIVVAGLQSLCLHASTETKHYNNRIFTGQRLTNPSVVGEGVNVSLHGIDGKWPYRRVSMTIYGDDTITTLHIPNVVDCISTWYEESWTATIYYEVNISAASSRELYRKETPHEITYHSSSIRSTVDRKSVV